MNKVHWFPVLLVLSSSIAMSAQKPDNKQREKKTTAPSLEFLQFLGEWQDGNGKFVAPQDVEAVRSQLKTSYTESSAKPTSLPAKTRTGGIKKIGGQP